MFCLSSSVEIPLPESLTFDSLKFMDAEPNYFVASVWRIRLLQSLLVASVLPSLCSATTQICDRLVYDSNEYSGDYDEFPLEDYWSDERPKPDEWLPMTLTSCWRGYVATWEVRNESLLLRSLSKPEVPYTGKIPIPLQSVFPGANGPVPANWFSGVLKCNRGADFNERLFISVYEGKILGIRKSTTEQLKNPSYEDLTWSSLLPPNENVGASGPRRWRLQSSRWIDGDAMFSWDGPVRSGKLFRLRGIYFPGGKLWTAPVSSHFRIEASDPVKLPTAVTPVEVTARSESRQGTYYLAVSRVDVLPVGSIIQRDRTRLDITRGQLVVAILIGSLLAMLGIGIFGRKILRKHSGRSPVSPESKTTEISTGK